MGFWAKLFGMEDWDEDERSESEIEQDQFNGEMDDLTWTDF